MLGVFFMLFLYVAASDPNITDEELIDEFVTFIIAGKTILF